MIERLRPFQVREGVKLPGSPFTLHRIVQSDGQPPPGSSKWAHFVQIEGGRGKPAIGKRLLEKAGTAQKPGSDRGQRRALISDAMTTGRFWPAKWHVENQQWIVTGPGVQYKGGKIVERFPLRRPGKAGGRPFRSHM